MAKKRRLASWEVSDEFWKRVEPLIPMRQRPQNQDYVRKPGARPVLHRVGGRG
jgi:putative transposase